MEGLANTARVNSSGPRQQDHLSVGFPTQEAEGASWVLLAQLGKFTQAMNVDCHVALQLVGSPLASQLGEPWEGVMSGKQLVSTS